MRLEIAMPFYAWVTVWVTIALAALAGLGAWAYVISLAVRALHKYVNS